MYVYMYVYMCLDGMCDRGLVGLVMSVSLSGESIDRTDARQSVESIEYT
jgi:hypothetical protein